MAPIKEDDALDLTQSAAALCSARAVTGYQLKAARAIVSHASGPHGSDTPVRQTGHA
jgi:hypothetical protein